MFLNQKSILQEITKLKFEVTCRICLSIYDDPVTLNNCQHTFCQTCVKKLSTFRSANANSVAFACPICKRLVKNRAFHLNEKFKAVVNLINMFEAFIEKYDKDQIENSSRKTPLSINYSSTSKKYDDDRLHQFLDDCIISVNNIQHEEEIYLLSSDENCDHLFNDNVSLCINVENVSTSQSSISNNKTVGVTITNSARKKKKLESAVENVQTTLPNAAVPQKKYNANTRKNKPSKKIQTIFLDSESTDVNSTVDDKEKCGTPETPDVCASGEKVEIINFIEEDFLNNIENEFHVSKTNESKRVTRNSNKKTPTTEPKKKTEWTRLKTIKNQIKKKERKYKQLKVNTDMHNLRTNDVTPKHLQVVSSNKTIDKQRRSGENLDNLLDCLNKNDNVNTVLEEDDIFAALTQKLNLSNPENVMEFNETSNTMRSPEKRKSNLKIIEPEPKKSKASTSSSDNVIFNKIVVEADVHCTPLMKIRNDSRKSKSKSQEILNLSNKNDEYEKPKTCTDISQIERCNSAENLLKQKEIEHDLKVISQKRDEMLSQFTNGFRAANHIVQQCENYSQSLFSDTLSKDSMNTTPQSDIDVPFKSNPFTVGIYSLPCLSDRHTEEKVKFLTCAVSSLRKIEDFYSQIISISQNMSREAEKLKFKDEFKINHNNEFNINEIAPKKINCEVQTDMYFDNYERAIEKNNCAVQTEILKCPKCSYNYYHYNDDLSKNATILNEPICVEQHIDNNLENEVTKSEPVLHKSFQEIYEEVRKISASKENKLSQGNEENSCVLQSSGSDIVKNKKVNSHLNFTDCQDTLKKSLAKQNKNYKRIRLATSDTDTDTESTDSKTLKRSKHETSRTKLYDNNLDVVFCSEMSGYDIPVETIPIILNNNIKTNENMVKNYKTDLSDNVFTEDTTLKYISILENEYKNVKFDKEVVENPAENVESIEKIDGIEKEKAENLDYSMHNTVLDNLLLGINVSSFEDEPNIIENTLKHSESMITEIVSKGHPEPEAMSASMFVDSEKYPKKTTPKKTLNKVAEENALDQEVADLTSTIVEDSFESDQDIFEDDNVIESTPPKDVSCTRDKSKLNIESKEGENVVCLIDPPELLIDNSQFDVIHICPPPPPLEFQDSEKFDRQINSTHLNIISMTPGILPLNKIDMNKIFDFTSSSIDIKSQQSNSINDRITIVQQIDSHNIENVSPRNITPTFETKNCGVSIKSLNPIVLAQEETFSPLNLIPAVVPKQNISITPKLQSSILTYMTPQKTTINQGDSATEIITKSNEETRRQTPIKDCSTNLSKMPQNSTSISKLNITKSSSNLSSLINTKYEAVVACTRLTQNEVLTVMSLASKFNVRCVKDFDKNITHLVVGTDNQNRAKDHTIKYILGIAHGLWILSMGWVKECVVQNKLVAEECYEILDISKLPGPRISRLTRKNNPLLADYKIYLTDPFVNVHKQDVETAILAVGGEIVKNPKELLKRNGKICLVLSDAKISEDFDYYQEFRESFHTIVADVEWLSQSIGRYQIISIIPYLLCLDNGIEHLGYPSALLMPIPESQSQMTCTNK